MKTLPKNSSFKVVNSISRCVDILKTLSNGIDRIKDISCELQLSKPTVHRILRTLEMSELVKQDPFTRRYYLGPLILGLASNPMIGHKHLTLRALDEMLHLKDFSMETVALHIRVGLERICLEEVQSPQLIKYSSGKGSLAPIYAGSAGKVLLAELEDKEIQFILESIHLSPIGPHTITDKGILLDELEKVRKQGYATSVGERLAGAAAISVPIKNYICPVSLSILGPENRLGPNKMIFFLKQMKKSATHISGKLI